MLYRRPSWRPLSHSLLAGISVDLRWKGWCIPAHKGNPARRTGDLPAESFWGFPSMSFRYLTKVNEKGHTGLSLWNPKEHNLFDCVCATCMLVGTCLQSCSPWLPCWAARESVRASLRKAPRQASLFPHRPASPSVMWRLAPVRPKLTLLPIPVDRTSRSHKQVSVGVVTALPD